MQAYGLRKGDELETRDLGAPSRHQKSTSCFRKKARRLLHKQARNDEKKTLREHLKELF